MFLGVGFEASKDSHHSQCALCFLLVLWCVRSQLLLQLPPTMPCSTSINSDPLELETQFNSLFYSTGHDAASQQSEPMHLTREPRKTGGHRAVKWLKIRLVLSHRPSKGMEGCVLDMELSDYHTFIHLFNSYRHSPI